MDLLTPSAVPWLVLGTVAGVLLAGMLALAAVWVRRSGRSSAGVTPTGAGPDRAAVEPEPAGGWSEDDLPGFLDSPPGFPPERSTPGSGAALARAAQDVPLAAPEPPVAAGSTRRRLPPPASAPSGAAPPAGRLLILLTAVAVLLVGAAAALAAVTTSDLSTRASAGASTATGSTNRAPTWEVPDLTAVPDRPQPGDPDAGRLAASSVPIRVDGALARLTFEGLVLERRAVGVTVGYPGVSLTAAAVPGGPALAHVRLPLWNCLTDAAPVDPVAAGCRRLPTEYAELPTPALDVTEDGDGLRLSGRFPTYVRPGGSPPEWTGRVYPLAVRVAADGDDVTGTLHLGTERADAVDDPLLNDFRRGR